MALRRGARQALATIVVTGGLAASPACVLAAAVDDASSRRLATRTPRAGVLRIGVQAAVPGQVVALSGRGLARKGARVFVGGKRAAVVAAKGLRVVVPALPPGRAAVLVVANGRRFTGTLRIRAGFGGRVRPQLEPSRAATRTIGSAGGTLSVRASDGTLFELVVPAGAVRDAVAIRLTPVARIGGFPFAGHPEAVQFGPDGLRLLAPATLRITFKTARTRRQVGFVYDGAGRELGLRVVRRSGRTIELAVEHFSSAGSTSLTTADLLILLGKLAHKVVTGRLTLEDVQTFAAAWSVLFVGNTSLCTADPTCAFVFGGALDRLERELGRYDCRGATGVVDGVEPRGSEAIRELRQILQVEANFRLFGSNAKAARTEDVRLCLSAGLVREAVPPAESDALGKTGVPLDDVDARRADADGDGKVNNCEWAVAVARDVGLQGFTRLQADATDACERGLQKVLDEGKARCDEVLSEGKAKLEDGAKVAAALGILTTEYAVALEQCKPKVFVTPARVSVVIVHVQAFTARSNEGDTDFTWTTTRGAIDQSGNLTAPGDPGTVIVTATTRRILSGTATVTVTCPAGQVAFGGQCATIAVAVSPPSVTLAPGGTQQFTPTVSNTLNQGVTWSATGGSVTANGGFYTAPQVPGTYTVRATSTEDPTKSGTATVTVGGAAISVDGRSPTDVVACSVDRKERSPSLPYDGVWNESVIGCGGDATATQSSNVEASATGQDWLHFVGGTVATSTGPSANATSTQNVQFTVGDQPVTVTCSGTFSSSTAGLNTGSLIVDVFGEQAGVTLTASGGVNVSFPLVATTSGHLLRIRVASIANDVGTVNATADITCDVNGPVGVEVND